MNTARQSKLSQKAYRLRLSSHKYLYSSLFFGAAAVGFGGGGLFYCLKYENEPGLAFAYTYILSLFLTSGPLGGGEILINFGKELRTFQFFSPRLLWPLALRLIAGPLLVSLAIVPMGVGIVAYSLDTPMSSLWLFVLNLALLPILAFAFGAFITALPRTPRLNLILAKLMPIAATAFLAAVVGIFVNKRGWNGLGKMVTAVSVDVQNFFDFVYTIPVAGPAIHYFFSPIYLLTKLHVGVDLPIGPQLAFAGTTLLVIGVLIWQVYRFTDIDMTASVQNWYHTTRSQQIEFYNALDEAVNQARQQEEATAHQAALAQLEVAEQFPNEEEREEHNPDTEPVPESEPEPAVLRKSNFLLPQQHTPEILLGMFHRMESRRETMIKWGGIFLVSLILSFFIGPLAFPMIWLVASTGGLTLINYLAPDDLSSQITPQRAWPLIWWKLRTSIITRIPVDIAMGAFLAWYSESSYLLIVPITVIVWALRTQVMMCGILIRANSVPSSLFHGLILIVLILGGIWLFTDAVSEKDWTNTQRITLLCFGLIACNITSWIVFSLTLKLHFDNLLHIDKLPKNP